MLGFLIRRSCSLIVMARIPRSKREGICRYSHRPRFLFANDGWSRRWCHSFVTLMHASRFGKCRKREKKDENCRNHLFFYPFVLFPFLPVLSPSLVCFPLPTPHFWGPRTGGESSVVLVEKSWCPHCQKKKGGTIVLLAS